MTRFINKAGDHADTDDILRAELEAAGIPTIHEKEGLPSEYMAKLLRKQSGEVKTSVRGTLHGWDFERSWYYWVASGPGIAVEDAEKLHAEHGQSVRVGGHCGCPSPTEYYHGLAAGLYHVDDPAGLRALADCIKAIVARSNPPIREVQPAATEPAKQAGRGPLGCDELLDSTLIREK